MDLSRSSCFSGRRLNLVAIFVCLFVPWLIFCFVLWLTSFRWFYNFPAVCYAIVLLVLGFVLYLGVQAWHATKERRHGEMGWEPTWHLFLFVTSLIAWALALYYGLRNFHYIMESYYGIENLGNYHGLDPGKQHGQQLMDAGRVLFQPGTHLDLAKSMSFRNGQTYCVAPIVSKDYAKDGAPESFDFWAVGVDCCCGDSIREANFQCGAYKNINAYAGLRLMRDEDRPFYRLAVQQAVGAYGIRANHPLFFHWVEDPIAAAESYRWEGHRQYLIGAYLHFAFQLFCVTVASCCFAQSEYEDR